MCFPVIAFATIASRCASPESGNVSWILWKCQHHQAQTDPTVVQVWTERSPGQTTKHARVGSLYFEMSSGADWMRWKHVGFVARRFGKPYRRRVWIWIYGWLGESLRASRGLIPRALICSASRVLTSASDTPHANG